jgi:hypothetical protein
MPGINEVFSDNPSFNVFGVVTGTQVVTYFPSGTAKILRFKADPNNNGVFKLGGIPQGQTFFPMSKGDDTGWIAPPSADGNRLGLQNFCYSNASASGTASRDYLYYWLQR